MPSFQSLFEESKGKPITYKGHRLHLADYVPFAQGDRVKVTFEQTSSEWRQGVALAAHGALEVAGQTINAPIVLWEDTAPSETMIRILAPTGQLEVKNVWDTGDGVIHSWHNGAAMIIEELPTGGRRYRCNDGHPDENFDDIVFRLEKLAKDWRSAGHISRPSRASGEVRKPVRGCGDRYQRSSLRSLVGSDFALAECPGL